MLHRFLPTAAATAIFLASIATTAATAAPSFERDVAAILRTRCAGCHHDGDASGELSMETFALLAKGGTSGPAFTAGTISGAPVTMVRDDQANKFATKNFTV